MKGRLLHSARGLVVVLLLSGCGGGSTGTATPTVTAAPTSTPNSCVPPTCAMSSAVVSSDARKSQAIPIPELGGSSGTLVLPVGTVAENATTLDVIFQSTPAGVVPLSAAARSPSSGTATAQFYLVLKPSRTITLPAFPSFTFVLPPALVVPGQTESLAYYNAALGTYQTVAGPLTVVGNVVTFTGSPTALTLVGGQSYVFVLFGNVAAPAANHPVPSPAAVAFLRAGETQVVTVTEPAYTGAFTASSTNTSIVSVARLSETSFLLTAGSTAGGALVIVSDSANRTWVVDVGVTLTFGTVR
jgi:hypothetical protein